MKSFFAIFTRNWGLKLLALVLAIIVFYTVRGSLSTASWRGRGHAPYFMKGSVDAAPATQSSK